MLRSWWARTRGRLQPTPCPFSQAYALESPLRRRFAGPDRILGAFGFGPGDRVLEIGPGIGYYSLDVARRVGADGHLICLDVQREMVQELRSRLRHSAQPRADVLRGSACELPICSNTVDHVFLIAVLGEIPDRSRALAEIRRVLRPGGRLSVSEQLPDPDFVTRRRLRRELSEAGFAEEATRGHVVYTSTWSAATSP